MRIAYSIERKQPGCVLLQAALGCDPAMAHPFHNTTWIVGDGVETLRVYEVTKEQLEKLIKITEAAHKDKIDEYRRLISTPIMQQSVAAEQQTQSNKPDRKAGTMAAKTKNHKRGVSRR